MKIKIDLNQFKQDEINLAKTFTTTADLIKFKNENSIFYKENGKFVNLNSEYGAKTALIYQFILSIAFKQAKQHNSPFEIKYKTINEHLTEEYKCSNQYISILIHKLIEEDILIRKRVGKNSWTMQLTPKGYLWVFGCEIGSRAYLLTSLKNLKYLIYDWFKQNLRIFKRFNSNEKLKNKLEIIKKVMLGISLYAKPNTQKVDDPPSISEQNYIKTSTNNFISVDDIFTDEDMEEMFGKS